MVLRQPSKLVFCEFDSHYPLFMYHDDHRDEFDMFPLIMLLLIQVLIGIGSYLIFLSYTKIIPYLIR